LSSDLNTVLSEYFGLKKTLLDNLYFFAVLLSPVLDGFDQLY